MSDLELNHNIVLALLLSADKPLKEKHVERCINEDIDFENIIQELNAYLNNEELPFKIKKEAKGYKVVTRKKYERWLKRLFQDRGNPKLSQAALETLSIVAYRQPVTKSEIDQIRGVNTSMDTLLDRNLVKVKGRLDAPGKPLLYSTTKHFLEYFGLNTIDDLPNMEEIEELLEEKEEKRQENQ